MLCLSDTADNFRGRLDPVIDLRHQLARVVLAHALAWIGSHRLAPLCQECPRWQGPR